MTSYYVHPQESTERTNTMKQPPFHIRPKQNFKFAGDNGPRVYARRVYRVESWATNQPNHELRGAIFVNDMLLVREDYEILP